MNTHFNALHVFVTMFFLLFLPFGKTQAQTPLTVEISSNGEAKFALKQQYDTRGILLSITQKGKLEIAYIGEFEVVYFTMRNQVQGRIKAIADIPFVYHYGGEFEGKLQKIGTVDLEYFDYYADEYKRGKLKRIGNYEFDYHGFEGGHEKQGKLKSINDVAIDYYYGFDNAGKISRIGQVRIAYNMDLDRDVNAQKLIEVIGSQQGVVVKTILATYY